VQDKRPACAAAAQLYDVELEPGDVVVFGSDGLFDNVWDHDIAAVVTDSIAVRTPTPLAQVLSCGDYPRLRRCCGHSAQERLLLRCVPCRMTDVAVGLLLKLLLRCPMAERRPIYATRVCNTALLSWVKHNCRERRSWTGRWPGGSRSAWRSWRMRRPRIRIRRRRG